MNLLLIFRCLIHKDTKYLAKCKIWRFIYTGMNDCEPPKCFLDGIAFCDTIKSISFSVS